MGVRFLSDQRLRLEDGTTLDGGRWLSEEDAGEAATWSRVLVHSYPDFRDVTDDRALVQQLLTLVRMRPRLSEYSAQLYAGGGRSVLVLHLHH